MRQLAATLRRAAVEAAARGLRGSAHMMLDRASELDRDPSASTVRDVCRVLALAVWRARAPDADGQINAAALALWERVLPRGVVVPRDGEQRGRVRA